MISFYPGPSRVHDEVPTYVAEAHQLGVLEMSHRSQEFMALAEKTVLLLKKKLRIPNHYTVLFASSATECWQIIAQSLIKKKSTHVYTGAFGKKWFECTLAIRHNAEQYVFNLEEELGIDTLTFHESDVICVTQNETSNGTAVSYRYIKQVADKHPQALVVVDATSSMGGVYLNFNVADCWFASVQKCFGLPAGLALMVLSPRAIKRAKEVGERGHYNSLNRMVDMMRLWQTTHTPNVLAIFLLMKVLEKTDDIRQTEKKLAQQMLGWQKFFKNSRLAFLIKNERVRSTTVLAIETTDKRVARIKREAKRAGILLGDGYGDYKTTTFRIANFPAIKQREIKLLQDFLKWYL
jgi:phosphoserine aminotransferase